jgi:hypothetical protein
MKTYKIFITEDLPDEIIKVLPTLNSEGKGKFYNIKDFDPIRACWFIQQGCLQDEEVLIIHHTNYIPIKENIKYVEYKVFMATEIPIEVLSILNKRQTSLNHTIFIDIEDTFQGEVLEEGDEFYPTIKYFKDQGCRNETIVVYYNK